MLYPVLETNDSNLDYYYDFSQSFNEYQKVFDSLNINWHWQPVRQFEVQSTLLNIKNSCINPLVLNLCDGDETNGTPGISVIHNLVQLKIPYTGADAKFYEITTSKIPMKQRFDQTGVSTPAWFIPNDSMSSIDFTFPLILKPAISGGSIGVSIKNVVHSKLDLQLRLTELSNGYRGWELDSGGIIAESFIVGREFTSFIVGSHSNPDACRIYEPIERVFHNSLPDHEKFLSFDRLWEIYEEEEPMPNDENFYEYQSIEKSLSNQIKELSLKAYLAVHGVGYGRLDIRMDEKNQLHVLEVNAQCGISEDENFTSIGAILRVSNVSFSQLVQDILTETLHRNFIL